MTYEAEQRQAIDTAAHWFARRDAGPMSEEETAAFDSWLSRNEAHRRAWQRMETVWSSLQAAPGAAKREAKTELQRTLTHRRARRRSVIAAGFAVVMAIGLGHLFDLPMHLRADEMTARGELRDVTLADGSIAHLDTRSAVAIDMRPDLRIVRLLRGRAFFEVAPGGAPFVVEADGVEVKALGTAFSVRRGDDGVRVVVAEHSVAVSEGDADAYLVVSEGERADMIEGRPAQVRAVDPAVETAWLRGVLVADDLPLGEVVAEIERYYGGFVFVTGKAGDMRVSGVFPVSRPLEAFDAIGRGFPVKINRVGGLLVVIGD